MKRVILLAASGIWLGIGVGLATKNWIVGFALAITYMTIAYAQRNKLGRRC